MPPLASFRIAGRDEAELLLRSAAFTHLVSFRDVGSSPLEGAALVNDRVELEFDDATSPSSAAFGYRRPELEDMRTLVDWLRERRGALREGTVLFQCEQGISRSTAGAVITLRVLGLSREEALVRVQQARRFAAPNPWMLELADGLLVD